MDVDVTLERLTELSEDVARGAYAPGDEPAHEMAELFQALDGWLTRKGFLPQRWAR